MNKTNPAQLPEELADILDRTLGESGDVGVLADWLDDHCKNEFWASFAAALRVSDSPSPDEHYYDQFRYQIVGAGVMFSLTKAMKSGGTQQTPTFLLSINRVRPADPAMWRRDVHSERLPKDVRLQLLETFGFSEA